MVPFCPFFFIALRNFPRNPFRSAFVTREKTLGFIMFPYTGPVILLKSYKNNVIPSFKTSYYITWTNREIKKLRLPKLYPYLLSSSNNKKKLTNRVYRPVIGASILTHKREIHYPSIDSIEAFTHKLVHYKIISK